ncbi:hypothetical protein GCM10027290_64350 [Micromonospora sonneratiae]|uniref:Uncharacterized protein n=1 Tax=Micromonospora sonneratiae TaxID=1184706 RepID=A0ABW3YEF8_9ACTN
MHDRSASNTPMADPVLAAMPASGFTVHLDFGAASLTEAREQAVRYAEALSILCPEIAIETTQLSYVDAWDHIEQLFCGAIGPDGEVCVDVCDHPGFHRADGLAGLAWGDGDPDPDTRR